MPCSRFGALAVLVVMPSLGARSPVECAGALSAAFYANCLYLGTHEDENYVLRVLFQ